jgi:tetratricopeptide (TPR) repeat protein
MEDFFEKSKKIFNTGDINNTLDEYNKALIHIDPTSKEINKSEYITFLEKILKHCEENEMLEEEAVVLRSLGRTHSIFKHHVESLKYHEQSLKIQRGLGNKKEVAEGLVFLAEDLEVSGNVKHCIEIFTDAANIFLELGKFGKEKEIRDEISRLKEFTEEMAEDEYIMNKFHVDNY